RRFGRPRQPLLPLRRQEEAVNRVTSPRHIGHIGPLHGAEGPVLAPRLAGNYWPLVGPWSAGLDPRGEGVDGRGGGLLVLRHLQLAVVADGLDEQAGLRLAGHHGRPRASPLE